MASTMFETTYSACQEITKTFDMVWALDAGLWNLRESTKRFYTEHPDATEKEAKDSLVQGLIIHGLNPKRIAKDLSWEYEEQYIAKLLLINATAIFDTWVDEFVEATISQQILQTIIRAKKPPKKSYTLGDKIKADFKAGYFDTYEQHLQAEQKSTLCGCFKFTAKKQDKYIENLRLTYKYFKSCRNCCAHGDVNFTEAAEKNYKRIKTFTKTDCGLKEFPKIEPTVQGNPFILYLRGVVGFYDVLRRIIKHYDVVASGKIAVDEELKKRWVTIPYQPIPAEVQKRITQARYKKKRNYSIRLHLNAVHMYAPYVNKTDNVYLFLSNNGLIV